MIQRSTRRELLRRVGAAAAVALGALMTLAPASAGAARAPAGQIATGQATTEQPGATRDLVIVVAADITTLDSHASVAATDVRVTLNLFDTLVTRTPDLTLQPALATSWQPLDDRRWQFTLRTDARFHDGARVTARDVKYSLERTLDPATGRAVTTIFSTIESVETPDDATVIITTFAPDSLLPARLSYQGGQIVPEGRLGAVGADAFAQAPVGSGVVQFASWAPGQQLVLTANPGYWGGPPDFDRVIFRVLPQARDRVQALLDGHAHIATRLAPEWRLRISRRSEAQPAEALYAGLYALGLNVTVPPLTNPLVRRALSLAIDRDTILKGMWLGRGVIPNGFVAQGDQVGYAAEWPPLPFDPAQARLLLAQAGYAGEPIVFEATDGYLENDAAMALVVTAMWQAVGVNVQLTPMSIAARAHNNRTRGFRGAWFSDPTSTIQDPDGMMVRLGAPGGLLDYWYDEEWLHQAFEARYSLDQQRRDAIYRDMQQTMLRAMPWIPIIQPLEGYGVSAAVHWRPHPTDRLELRRSVLTMRR